MLLTNNQMEVVRECADKLTDAVLHKELTQMELLKEINYLMQIYIETTDGAQADRLADMGD